MNRSRVAMFIGIVVTAIAIGMLSWRPIYDFARGYAEARAGRLSAFQLDRLSAVERGAVIFAFYDFGALNTDAMRSHAVPWRLVAAALVLREREKLPGLSISQASLQKILQGHGFLFPSSIDNWPANVELPTYSEPLGITFGLVERSIPSMELGVGNLGCAACHAGVTYSATGAPQPESAHLGSPNTSLDLEAYTLSIYEALKIAISQPEGVLAAARQLFPEMTAKEESTLRRFIVPRVRETLTELAQTTDRPTPFSNGAPGLTNGVAALKVQLSLEDAYPSLDETGFTSIPDLGSRTWRTSLLWDGAYAVPALQRARQFQARDVTDQHLTALAAIVTFFSVPSMGIHPDRARMNLPYAADIMRFLNVYRPQRYPAPIDGARASEGREVYSESCAICHGTYDDSLETPQLVAFPNWIGTYDTDPMRWQSFDETLSRAIGHTSYRDVIDAKSTRSYAAPPLTGLWASAPYLHNGSVPTLRQLMFPAERPKRFLVGGHRLNLEAIGIDGYVNAAGDYVYPAHYAPWSHPVLIDTSRSGLSNSGHETEFAQLSERQKTVLLEYLKLL